MDYKKELGYLCLELATYHQLRGDYENAYKFYMLHKEYSGEDINYLCKLGGYYYEVGQIDDVYDFSLNSICRLLRHSIVPSRRVVNILMATITEVKSIPFLVSLIRL